MLNKNLNKTRSRIIILAVLVTGLFFAAANPVRAQESVGEGGVGESGSSSQLIYQVTGNRDVEMVFRTTKTSLCPNTGAVAMLVVNGEPVKSGKITADDSSIKASAKQGEWVVVVVQTIPLFNEVMCVRLGELEFTLEKRDIE